MAPGLTRVALAGSEAGAAPRDDLVALEEPLELVVDGQPLAILMRTPTGVDDDVALAAGFLVSEGVVDHRDDLRAIAPCADPAAPDRHNRVLVALAEGVRRPVPSARAFVATSACGICGAASIAALEPRVAPRGPPVVPSVAEVVALGEAVRPHQRIFAATGAVHGAALFAYGRIEAFAEDVGRHNAVDKVLGRRFLDGRWPIPQLGLWVSGRVAFEIVQKALVAGVTSIVAVGAPTSLAVDLARAHGLPLVAFVRGVRMNVYAPA